METPWTNLQELKGEAPDGPMTKVLSRDSRPRWPSCLARASWANGAWRSVAGLAQHEFGYRAPGGMGRMVDMEFRVTSDRREGLLLALGQVVIASGFGLVRQRMLTTAEGVVLTLVVRGPEDRLL